MAPMDAIWLLLVLTWPFPATLWLSTHPTLIPYMTASGIEAIPVKYYLKINDGKFS